MKNGFLVFPGGSTGVALLLLRAAVALNLLSPFHGDFRTCFAVTTAFAILALAVAVGLYTRLATMVALLAALCAAIVVEIPAPLAAATFILQSIALILVGPGAISIDALRFGRRTVHIGR